MGDNPKVPFNKAAQEIDQSDQKPAAERPATIYELNHLELIQSRPQKVLSYTPNGAVYEDIDKTIEDERKRQARIQELKNSLDQSGTKFRNDAKALSKDNDKTM